MDTLKWIGRKTVMYQGQEPAPSLQRNNLIQASPAGDAPSLAAGGRPKKWIRIIHIFRFYRNSIAHTTFQFTDCTG